MPIDPQIALEGKPAQIEDPLSAYGKVLSLQNAQQQQQAGAQRLQMGDIELKQQQRALQYQQTFSDAVKNNTTQSPDGSLATDWSGVQRKVTDAGFGDRALAMNTELMKAKEAGLDLIEKQHKIDTDRVNDFASAVGSLPKVDPAQPYTVSAFNAAFPAVLGAAVAKGTIQAAQGQQLQQQFQQGNGWTPQLGALVDAAQQRAMTAQQQAEHASKVIDQAREQGVADTTITKNKADTDKIKAELADKAKSEAAATLSQASNASDYDARKAKIADPNVAGQFPDSKDLNFSDPKSFPDQQERILKLGMNAEQLSQYQLRKENNQSLAENREQSGLVRQQMADFRTGIGAALNGIGQKEADKTKTQVMNLQRQEQPLWEQAKELSDAIAGGKMYVPKTGAAKPLNLAAAGNSGTSPADIDEGKKGLVEDMRSRLEGIKDTLRSKVNEKYDLGDQYNAKYKDSREDVLKQVEAIGTDATLAASQAKKAAAGAPATPAVATPATKPAQAAKPPATPAGKIRVRLSDGRTGSLDPKDFDAKTMSKL